jgi:xanthine/uracil/vitamin C permease (AzgA family)
VVSEKAEPERLGRFRSPGVVLSFCGLIYCIALNRHII